MGRVNFYLAIDADKRTKATAISRIKTIRMAAALLYGLRRADAKRRKGNRAKGKISESNLKGKGRRKVMGDIIIQAVGFFGVALFMASYQIRSNRALFLCQMLGCMVFCFQFFLLGAYTGALTLVVNAARNYLLIKSSCWKWARSKAVLIFIIALLAAISLSTWDSWVSMLPFASVTATSIGYWTNNAQKIRISQLIGSPLVLVYDALIHSWGGVLNESLTLASILISIVRFGWKKLGENSNW